MQLTVGFEELRWFDLPDVCLARLRVSLTA